MGVGGLVAANLAGAAEAPVNLGTARSFSVLAGAPGVTNGGPTVVGGDLGTCPGAAITGFPPGVVNGTTHPGDGVACGAQDDATTAYNDAAGRAPTTTYAGPTQLGGTTLVPGVYKSPTSFAITGTLTLDARGDANAVFIFQAGSTLDTATDSEVLLVNGAQDCNVFWQVGSSATLGVGSTFVGTILALISISANTDARVDGRLLAKEAVTLLTNTITTASCATTTTTSAVTTTTTAVTTTTSTLPTVTLPPITLPDLTFPGLTLPDLSFPGLTLPDLAFPDLTLPDGTLPDVTIPVVSLPVVNVPTTTVASTTTTTVGTTATTVGTTATTSGTTATTAAAGNTSGTGGPTSGTGGLTAGAGRPGAAAGAGGPIIANLAPAANVAGIGTAVRPAAAVLAQAGTTTTALTSTTTATTTPTTTAVPATVAPASAAGAGGTTATTIGSGAAVVSGPTLPRTGRSVGWNALVGGLTLGMGFLLLRAAETQSPHRRRRPRVF